MVFRGTISEPGSVTITANNQQYQAATTVAPNGSPEGMYYFTARVNLPSGANTVQVAATDLNGAQPQKSYSVTVNPAASPAYTFDADGNCTSDGTRTYEWDAENRLVAVNNGSVRTEFGYDGFGRRVKIVEKNNGVVSGTKQFVWSGTDLCEERDGGDNVTKRFFAEGEQMGGANYYFTRDHLGSVREMTDGSGAIRAEYDYDPYGVQTKVQGDLDADFGYAGYYRHAPSGLDLTLFRAYDPVQGRWLSRDPIGEIAGINLYGYVGNAPANFTDPFGLLAPMPAGGDIAGIGEAVADEGALELIPETGPEGWVAAAGYAAGTAIDHATGFSDWLAKQLVPDPDTSPLPLPAGRGIRPPKGPHCKGAPPGFPGDQPENHHRLPRQFGDWFAQRGLNVEDYTQEMPMQWHRGADIGIHSLGYNQAWENFIESNPDATAEQALQFLNDLEFTLGF